jgi:hypothetical protein
MAVGIGTIPRIALIRIPAIFHERPSSSGASMIGDNEPMFISNTPACCHAGRTDH